MLLTHANGRCGGNSPDASARLVHSSVRVQIAKMSRSIKCAILVDLKLKFFVSQGESLRTSIIMQVELTHLFTVIYDEVMQTFF